MKKSTIAGLVSLAFTSPIFAAETINLDDVVVTASRVAQSRESVIGDVTVISREEIESAGQSTLAELLSTQPGIEIESNGGVGATSNIHIRGTNSQSVVVLIDGMRVASATLGTTSFSQIIPEQIDHIEIVRGPASSLYGSDAIGGVIQIFTKQGKGVPHLSASAGYGSNNTQQASAGLSGATDNTRFSLGVASLTTDGISSLRTHTGLDKDRDAFRNLSFNGNITRTITEGHEVGAQAYTSQGHYNFDGNNFPANQDLRQQSFALFSKNKIMDAWVSNLRIGESMDDLKSEGSFGESALRTKQRQYSWQNDITLPLGKLVLAYDRLEDKVKADVDFTQKSRGNNGYLASYLLEQEAHAFKFGLRRDNNSQFGNYTTGNIGYGYRLNSFWRVSGSYGTAFRAPTFNDLYWPFQDFGFGFTYQGNPNLKPETSRNKEISLAYDQGHHRVSATIFHNEINNLLVGSQGIANDFPVNVGTATIKGLTLAYEGWFDNYHLRASADIQDPRNDDTDKILSRRARQHGSVWLGQNWGNLEVGSEIIASGKRFNDADNEFVLAGYTLVNITAKYKVDDSWSLNARVNNLFDRKYALATTANSFSPISPDYNTSGTNIFVSLRYSPSN
ncbi:MAG TPA: TonB-dependent receptor [Methylotenera sp.]|nr:TonB-dependent receptor [Methylotenera sp.]